MDYHEFFASAHGCALKNHEKNLFFECKDAKNTRKGQKQEPQIHADERGFKRLVGANSFAISPFLKGGLRGIS